jgi:hypothetical protein
LPNDFRTSRICTDDIVSPLIFLFFGATGERRRPAVFSTLMPEAEFNRHHHPQFVGF